MNHLKDLDEVIAQEKSKTQEYIEVYNNMCSKCLMPVDPDCEICNGHTLNNIKQTQGQLDIPFTYKD